MQEDSQERSRFRNIKQNVAQAQQQQPVYHPGIQVQSPISVTGDIDSAKMGMLFSIIGGIIALAIAVGQFMTSELDSDMEFLYLASGAFLLVLFSYGFVEVQYRRHGEISIVHDYILSFGHLFAVLGGFWLSRWGLYFYCGYFPDAGIMCHGEPGGADWMPGEWGVLAQAIVFALLGFAQWQQNERVKATILPRLVTVLSPLVILLIGAKIWVDWADGSISLPVILSALTLSGMGMWLGSTSNRAPLFLSSAFLSSFIPIVFELSVGGGAGLSLLAIVVLMQGVFASAQGLSQKMIQQGSIFLVLMIIIAEFWAVTEKLDIVLVYTIDNAIISLPLFIWLSLLIGYFIPVHMRRVPWMPIGLAIGLLFLPSPGSVLAWSLAIIAFVYMLNKSQTRRWVADWTYAMLATSWFVVDWLSWIGGPFETLALDPNFLIVPPAALMIIGYIGSRYNRLSSAPYHLAVLLLLLSHEMLFGSGALLPLLFVIYLMLLILRDAISVEEIDEDDSDRRNNVSLLVLVTGFSVLVLEWMGRLDTGLGDKIGVSDLGVEALLLSVALYAIGRNLRTIEYDVRRIASSLLESFTQVSDWNPLTGEWSSKSRKIEHVSLGPAMRGSMILPLLIFSLSAAAGNETWIVLLLLLPIMVLMREILFELPQDNKTRASGIWLLFFVGLPWSFRIHQSLFSSGSDSVVAAQIIFDLIMVSGPLLGQFMLTRKGVEFEEGSAADWLLYGVMAVALLDVSGGILFVSLMMLAMVRSIQHRRKNPIILLPLAWALGSILLTELPATIIDYAPEISSLLVVRNSLFLGVEFPAWVGLGWLVIGLIPLVLFSKENMSKDSDEIVNPYPVIMPFISLLAGLHLLIPEPHLLILAAVIVAAIGAYFSGQMAVFWTWPLLFVYALDFASEKERWLGDEWESHVFTITSLITWALTILYWKGILQSRSPPSSPVKEENIVTGLYTQLESLIMIKNPSAKELLGNVLLAYALIFSWIGLESFMGIAFLISSFVVSYRLWEKRYAKVIFASAIFQAIAIDNTTHEIFGGGGLEASGSWLILIGLFMTWSSWRIWDWEWNEASDETVIKLSNYAGIYAACYVPIGALIASDGQGLWLFGAVLSVFGGIQMMIGFEQDQRWRRIYTLISIPLGILIVASDISNGVLQGVMYLLAALTLFGQGFLYMTRAGLQVSGTTAMGDIVAEEITIAEAPLTIPPPVTEADLIEEEEAVDAKIEPTPILAPAPPKPTRFDSGDGFDVELPMDVIDRISSALQGTNYEGYRPIVKWDSYGQVILDFEQITD